MKTRILLPLLAIAMASPASASPGSLRDFQLPSPTPTSTPQAQGPVDDQGAVPVRPRVIASPTPTPTSQQTTAATDTPAATRTVSPAPATSAGQSGGAVVQALPENYREPQSGAPQRSQPIRGNTLPNARLDQERPSATPPLSTTPEIDSDDATTQGDNSALDAAASEISVAPVSNDAAPSIFSASMTWLLIAFAAVLAALIGAFAFWKRRSLATTGAPVIEAPLARTPLEKAHEPTPEPVAPMQLAPATSLSKASAPQSSARVPVQVKAEAISLSRSMMNATLHYRLSLRNLGTQPLRGMLVKVDVVTAHGKAPVAEQLANRDSDLPLTETITDLAARETHETEGEFRLPVNQIRTIPQGKARLFVPLLRVRIEAPDKEPLTRTFVIGMLPPEGQSKLQPFRLDEMAQTYRQIGLRALD